MSNNDTIYIFYYKKDYEVLTSLEMNDTQIDLEDFIVTRLEVDEKFKHLTRDDIGITTLSKTKYKEVMTNQESDISWAVNPLTGEFDFTINKRIYNSEKNKTYLGNEYNRQYTLEQVEHMYNEDYINFNLKKSIECGIYEAKFIAIKDLKIRPRISHRAWKYFTKDPYLKDIYDDKLKLGRSIMEIGTYYPFVVAPLSPDDDSLYVFEGNHRIMSLKLLAMDGEISEDFKVLCLILPEDYHSFRENQKHLPLRNPTPYRYVLDDLYGCDIFHNQELMDRALQEIKKNGEKLLNNYTVEAMATRVSDFIRVMHTYPMFLRDLIYSHNNAVKPSEIINNEEKFKEWLQK